MKVRIELTEKTLNEAIKIKNNLDKAREIRSNIKEKRNLCIGNTSEVNARKFELSIDDGKNIKTILISSRAAYEALSVDLDNANKIVVAIETELEQLD